MASKRLSIELGRKAANDNGYRPIKVIKSSTVIRNDREVRRAA